MKKFNNIMCVVEPTSSSEAAAIQALKIAQDHQADITFVSFLDKAEGWTKIFKHQSELNKKLEELSTEKLNSLKNWLNQFEINPSTDIKLYKGIGFIDIIKDVNKENYDLVVKSAENIGWLGRLFASDDMHLLRKCPCPVLMLKPGQKNVFSNVLATVDVNDEYNEGDSEKNNDSNDKRVQLELNKSVMNYAATFSISNLTDLQICSVWNAFGESHLRHSAFSNTSKEDIDNYVDEAKSACLTKLKSLVRDFNDSMGKDVTDYLKPQTHLVKGIPSKEIVSMASTQNIDLIVMGSVARIGIPGFIIGNTAESILGQVQCSVLVIKPDGFISPVLELKDHTN